MKAPPSLPPSPGVVFTHLGQRYVLGYHLPTRALRAGYGIWDRRAPGSPVERFPLSAPGWSSALDRYATLEPEHGPNEAPPACPRCGNPAMARRGPADDRGRMLFGFLVGGLLGGLLASSNARWRCPRCNAIL